MDKNKKGGAMNDFDFEELDKAVSSLAAKTKTENNLPASSAPSPVTVTPATRRSSPTAGDNASASVPVASQPPSPQSDTPKVPASDPEPTTETPPTVQHAKRLAVTPPRRRGAFMDIVAPAKVGARHMGTTLQPVSTSVVAEPKPEAHKPVSPETSPAPLSEPDQTANTPPVEAKNIEDHAPEIMTTKVQAPEPEPATTPKASEPAWPDPLDFHGLDDGEQQPKEQPAEEPPRNDEKPTQSSPFLPEAKVEKRPLGAFSSFGAKPADDHTAIPESAPELKPEDELTPEADGTFKEPDEPKAPTMHDAPKEHKPANDEQKPDGDKPDVHGAAMMSIPKQYHTKEKAADTTKRPIFDTKEYHPPLLDAAVHEHRGGGSMWSKLFIALATLVLLGVAGYFAYLYFVQQ